MVLRFNSERSGRGLVLSAILATSSALPVMAASQDVTVLIDQATLVRLERPAAELVVGNPSIADVAVQSGKVLVITGKSFGETNLIVMDASGNVVVDRRLVVQEPDIGYVTFYKGSERFTLHCAPNCETPLVIGDSPKYFEGLAKEIKSKQSISQTSAEGEKQSE